MIAVCIFGILSILCFIYFIIITSYAGIHTTFAPIWIAVGLFFLITAVVLFLQHRHKINIRPVIKIILTTIFGICVLVFVIVEGLIISAMNKQTSPNLDYIIVLGAQVRGVTITKSLAKRLDSAVDYLNDNEQTIVVVSGGQGEGEDATEASCMRDYLIDHNIDESRIILEEAATNTQENIAFSMELIEESANSSDDISVGVVTNNFHVYRAVAISNKQGHDVSGISAPCDNTLFINYMVREFFAVIKYKISNQI